MERHVYPWTVVSVSYHYKYLTKHVSSTKWTSSSLKCILFSLWYSWKNCYLGNNSQQSLTWQQFTTISHSFTLNLSCLLKRGLNHLKGGPRCLKIGRSCHVFVLNSSFIKLTHANMVFTLLLIEFLYQTTHIKSEHIQI